MQSHDLPSLAPNQHQEIIVEHRVTDLGQHTLLCASAYANAQGERKYHPQAFRFVAQNPLLVRTKVWMDGCASILPIT